MVRVVRNFIVFSLVLMVLFISCIDRGIQIDEEQNSPSLPVSGVVYFEAQDSAKFVDVALLLTDTMELYLLQAEGFEYVADGILVEVLDSVLSSKSYISYGYKLISHLGTVTTDGLEFVSMDSTFTFDWEWTVDSFNLEDAVNPIIDRWGYVKVPDGAESLYVSKLLEHPWFIKKAGLVYGTTVVSQ